MKYDLKVGNKIYEGIEKIETTDTSGNTVDFFQPSGSVNIYSNGVFDIPEYAIAIVDVGGTGTGLAPMQWASGFKDCSAGQSFKVEGLSFTPKGFAFMVAGNISENTNISSVTNSLFYCIYDTTTNPITYRRAVGHNENYSLRVNPLETNNCTVFYQGFEYAGSDTALYNVMSQRYFWVAWG